MLNCLACIAGSMWVGGYLDRSKNFKKTQIVVALSISTTIAITFLMLHNNLPNFLVIIWVIISGAPISSVSVVSYQFAAEVSYPISEVQAVSLMNVMNKLITFGVVKLTTAITEDTPESINYMYGFLLWIGLPLIGIVPAFFVEEDLRRLNMKDVGKSIYIEEKVINKMDKGDKKIFYRDNKIIAGIDVLEGMFMIDYRRSARETYKPESMLTSESA